MNASPSHDSPATWSDPASWPEPLQQSLFLRAARCEPTETTPVWIMRQAGRYMPQYMAVRRTVSFIELCKRPELAAEVTLTAQRVLGVDAAILFADLLPILEPMGFRLEYVKGDGPKIRNPIRTPQDVQHVQVLENPDELAFVYDAARLVRAQLPADIPLLGFAGAPFTLASYVIEGGGSRHYARTKELMFRHPRAWDELMAKLTDSLIKYINRQVEAGCQAVQIFDSWAGCLSPHDYRQFVAPHTRRLIAGITEGIPVINFLTGNPALIPCQVETGGSVIGVDWRMELCDVLPLLDDHHAVQGNLDPLVLHAEPETIRQHARRILGYVGKRPGHIFNLGHGVLPDTPLENVQALVQMVHDIGAELRG